MESWISTKIWFFEWTILVKHLNLKFKLIALSWWQPKFHLIDISSCIICNNTSRDVTIMKKR